MEALNGGVFIANPTGHLKVESERIWGWANDLGLARLVCISRPDREEGTLAQALAEMTKTLDAKLVSIHVPIGSQANFRGVVDLLSMKSLIFQGTMALCKSRTSPATQGADEYRENLLKLLPKLLTSCLPAT